MCCFEASDSCLRGLSKLNALAVQRRTPEELHHLQRVRYRTKKSLLEPSP